MLKISIFKSLLPCLVIASAIVFATTWLNSRLDREKDETWYSKFMDAEISDKSGDWDKALNHFIDAFRYDPARAEPLLRIANHYRLNGQNELAYVVAKIGSTIPRPTHQSSHTIPEVYDYQFQEEISITANYLGKNAEGLAASDFLIFNRNVPPFVKKQAYINLMYYVEPLKNVTYLPTNIKPPPLADGSNQYYNATNPSILKTKDGYQINHKTINFVQKGAISYQPINAYVDYILRTRNFIITYDKDFNLLSQQEIVENIPREKHKWRNVAGLEDCRLFNLNNQTWFTCSTDDTNTHQQVQMCLCKMSENTSGETIQVEKLIPLIGPDPDIWEKNWLPFILNNELHLIYGYNPFIIYKPNVETGISVETHRYTPKHDFSVFRGSAAPIEFDDGYLMMVHEVARQHYFYYYHRFLYLDHNFEIVKTSKPFVFKNTGIEFCAAMTIDHSGKNLVMGVGIEDREAYIGIVDLDTVRAMLQPLP